MMKKRKIICQFQKFALVHYYYFEVIIMDQGELFSQFIMGRLYHNVVIRKMDIVLYQNWCHSALFDLKWRKLVNNTH